MSVVGTVEKDPNTGEIYIAASSVTPTGATNLLGPLGLINEALGGGNLTNALGNGQVGVAGGTGLNNIGLLIRTTGLASNIGASGFTLTDGSGIGVTVSATGIPSSYNGKYVMVTGISGIGSGGASVIKVRSASDVQAVD